MSRSTRSSVAAAYYHRGGFRKKLSYEARYHGRQTRCLRFEVTVARVLPYDLARLASERRTPCLLGRDFHPRVTTKGFDC